MNLNELKIKTVYDLGYDKYEGRDQKDNSKSSGKTTVYFKDIKNHLIRHINQAESILGCVAWLTDFDILDAMVNKQVQLIVQKEDFLRPDCGVNKSGYKKALQSKYNALKCDLNKWAMLDHICCHDENYNYVSSIESVRCVGNHNSNNQPSHPRMHNKFVLFCDLPQNIQNESPEPYAVWTGSFNFSRNAGNSFENALYITDKDIVGAYFKEYQQITMFSESLNWSSNWVKPEIMRWKD